MIDDSLYRALLIDYLDSAPGSAEVLSDYLEENGAERLKDLAPAARMSQVIALMPVKQRNLAIRLMVRGLVDQIGGAANSPRIGRFIEQMRRWLAGGGDSLELERLGPDARSLAAWTNGWQAVSKTLDLFDDPDVNALRQRLRALRTQATNRQTELDWQRALVREALRYDCTLAADAPRQTTGHLPV